MAVVIETTAWEPNPSLFVFIFLACLLSVFLLPYAARSAPPPSAFDHGAPLSSSSRFQRSFLLLYSLCSVMEGLSSVFGEFEFSYFGVSRERMVLSLCVGFAGSLVVGSFLGVLSDAIGHRKFCLFFCILHLFVGVWKTITAHPSVWVASICLSLASSIYSFSFETWMVVEHEKQGHREDLLSDTFWLMAFLGSASFIGSQVLANWLIGDNLKKRMTSPSMAAVFLALVGVICVARLWRESSRTEVFEDHGRSYFSDDRRVWLLACAQASLHFSVSMFWILWTPMLVADGRELHLGLIYPCLLGARMLGSTIFPWLISGSLSFRTEDCILYAFIISGCVLSVVAYDYQEIGVLVTLFCLFQACVGVILPSLARLRTMYVPNGLRGGMISFSLAPANAAVLLFLVQGGYYRSISNAAIMAFAAIGLFAAAGCMHVLKRLGKQPYQHLRKL
ncbi:uncharacterized protein LOC115676908 isoform X1 [Syzygium oleosum]|uniref:uncharacterized protein LOC115676908 isoform X1 n=1 Tax=Syzygium oleosum TaxID=219896 RepID=UPI0024B8BF60|nr:uncharacterized protein LOC115676908 isoform X1 [Syzygium oleosum]